MSVLLVDLARCQGASYMTLYGPQCQKYDNFPNSYWTTIDLCYIMTTLIQILRNILQQGYTHRNNVKFFTEAPVHAHAWLTTEMILPTVVSFLSSSSSSSCLILSAFSASTAFRTFCGLVEGKSKEEESGTEQKRWKEKLALPYILSDREWGKLMLEGMERTEWIWALLFSGNKPWWLPNTTLQLWLAIHDDSAKVDTISACPISLWRKKRGKGREPDKWKGEEKYKDRKMAKEVGRTMRTYRCLRRRPNERPGPRPTSVIKRNRKTKCKCALFGVEWVQVRKPREDGRSRSEGKVACKVCKVNDEC